MILRLLTDKLIRAVSAAVNTNDGRYDPLYVESLIPNLREDAIKFDYFGSKNRAGSRRLDYSLTQSITVSRDATQDKEVDYITFTVPKPISVGRMVDGLVYVGQKNNSVAFAKLLNREDVANMRVRGLFDGRTIGYIYEGNKVLCFGNMMLQEINVRGIFSDPTTVPNFSIEQDDYPVTDSIFNLMVDLFKQNQNININRPTDIIEDGKETIR